MVSKADYEGKIERINQFIEKAKDLLRLYDSGDKSVEEDVLYNLKVINDLASELISDIQPKLEDVRVKRVIKAAKAKTKKVRSL